MFPAPVLPHFDPPLRFRIIHRRYFNYIFKRNTAFFELHLGGKKPPDRSHRLRFKSQEIVKSLLYCTCKINLEFSTKHRRHSKSKMVTTKGPLLIRKCPIPFKTFYFIVGSSTCHLLRGCSQEVVPQVLQDTIRYRMKSCRFMKIPDNAKNKSFEIQPTL